MIVSIVMWAAGAVLILLGIAFAGGSGVSIEGDDTGSAKLLVVCSVVLIFLGALLWRLA